jgi:hypothetical protein
VQFRANLVMPKPTSERSVVPGTMSTATGNDKQRSELVVDFVQVTPPTSACSIAFGEGISEMTPGTQNGIQAVVPDAEAARKQLVDNGVEATPVQKLAWGSFTSCSDPDGNTCT